jgi:hypothetical protein
VTDRIIIHMLRAIRCALATDIAPAVSPGDAQDSANTVARPLEMDSRAHRTRVKPGIPDPDHLLGARESCRRRKSLGHPYATAAMSAQVLGC